MRAQPHTNHDWPRNAHATQHTAAPAAAAAPSPAFGPAHASSPHLPPASLALQAASSALAGAAFSSKLLGVALVASADFGTRCLFRYPVPPPVKANSGGGGKQNAGAGGLASSKNRSSDPSLQSSASFGALDSSLPPSPMLRAESANAVSGSAKDPAMPGDSGIDSDSELAHAAKAAAARTADSGSNGGGGGASSAAPAAAEEMYGMSPDDFARLFCPKQALCAQVLDVMVDALRFVSFPIRLHYQESRAHQRRARSARHKARLKQRHKVNRKGGTRMPGAMDSMDVTESKEDRLGEHEEKKSSSAEHPGADGATVDSAAAADASAASASSSSSSDDDDAASDSSAEDDDDGGGGSHDHEHDLTYFNVVFILSGSTSQSLAGLYGNVAALLSRALLHEQTRAHFVSQQAQLLVTIRDRYLNSINRAAAAHGAHSRPGNASSTGGGGGGGGSGGASGSNGASASAPGVSVDFHALSHLLLRHSLLANHLYHLYYSLIHQEYDRFGAGGGGFGVAVGPGLSMSLLGSATLPPGAQQAQMGSMEDAAAIGGATHNQFGHVPPSHGAAGGRSSATYVQDGVASVAAAFQKLGLQYAGRQGQNTGASQQPVAHATTSAAVSAARGAAHRLLQLDHSHTQLLINNWFMLHFSLTPAFTQPTYNPHCTPAQDMPTLQPYHTILLTVPVPTLLQSLPADCSPLLRTLIRHADPRHSFHALSCTLRIPLPHLYKLVSHLLYWNKCLLLEVITMENTYAINPAFCQLGNRVATGQANAAGNKGRGPSVAFAATAAASSSNAASSAAGGARRSSSSRPSGHGGALNPSTSTGNLNATSRRRSASTEGAALHAAAAPSFIPAPLLYEYSQHWPAATFLAFLARISTRRTLGEHLQRVAFAPAMHAANQQASASPAFTSSAFVSSHAPSAASSASALSAVQRELQNEFMSQLLFLLKKQWVRQVQKFFVRIDTDEEEAEDDEAEEQEQSQPPDDREQYELARGMRRSGSASSLRSFSGSESKSASPATAPKTSSDPWLSLLDRLTPLYFDGSHSATEICWRERESGLSFAHLLHLCKLFPRQLFMVQHIFLTGSSSVDSARCAAAMTLLLSISAQSPRFSVRSIREAIIDAGSM